jgi:hypothetical protein
MVHGSITWVGMRGAFCGPRCTNLTVYQASDTKDIKYPSMFLCNNTISEIKGGEKEFTHLTEEDKAHAYGNDAFARIAAGAIAWTGFSMDNLTDRQTQEYLKGQTWSPYYKVNTTVVEDLVSRFSIGAIAAYDDHGSRYEVQNQKTRPVQGQQLQVDWSWILSLLFAICIIQLGALITLLALANKSIIRDESFFSLAMLLTPVVNRIGPQGMNWSGTEIKEDPRLCDQKIRYDYRRGGDGEPNFVDIFFEAEDNIEPRRTFENGVYG